MSQPPPTDIPQPRRPRKERGKRSKNGCQTCLNKRVKCDEKHPACDRCTRLLLTCEWPVARPSLAQRRRGFGPLKDRPCWTPKAIYQKGIASDNAAPDVHQENAMRHASEESTSQHTTYTPHVSQHGHMAINETNELPEHTHMAQELWSNTDMIVSSGRINCHTTYSDHPCTSSKLAQDIRAIHNTLSSPFCTWSGANDILETKDMQALSFHRTIFAPLKSTQDSSRSAHSLFLHRAFDRRMALHFLLAVSHHELAIYQDHTVDPPRESCRHYRCGTDLLQQHTRVLKATTSDHLNVMISFLYMYLFWMRRSHLDPVKLDALSKTVLVYIRDCGIDSLCSPADLLVLSTNYIPGLAIAASDQILLARIIIYLYDRDGFCCFFGCGGLLARFVNATMPEKRDALWEISRIPFLWPVSGVDLPGSQEMNLDDRLVLDVYFQLIVLHQDINCLSQATGKALQETELSLHRRLDQLRQKAPFLAFLAEDESLQRTAPLMAYVTATVFYATCVYLDRATGPGFGSMRSPRINNALASLLKVAYRTVSVGSVQLLERFQWSLLIAGMETSDDIYRDWVTANISDSGIRDLLKEIIRKKSQLGGVISMSDIRQLTSNT